MKRLVIALLGAGAMSLVIAAGASAHVVTCRPYSMGLFNFRNWQDYALNLSVRNMACGSAKRAMHNGYVYVPRRIGPWVFRTPGFACRDVSYGPAGAVVRCTRGSAAFRFTIGT